MKGVLKHMGRAKSISITPPPSNSRRRSRGASFGLLSAIAAAILTHGAPATAQHGRLNDGAALYMAHSGAFSAAGGHAAQGYLGVSVRDVADEAKAGAGQPRGAEILHLDHDGPAGKAGLREHDIIVSVNGLPVESAEPLRRMLHEMAPGRSVTLIITRSGQQQTVTAIMTNREDLEREAWEQHITVPDPQNPPPAPALQPAPDERRGTGFFSTPGRVSRNLLGSINPAYTGAMLETMAPQLAEYFGSQGRTGLLVRSVDANSPAALAGMRAGDVVVRVNATPIVTSNDWLHAVRENKGKSIAVVVLRDRREQTLLMVPFSRHHSSLMLELWPRMGSSFRGNAQPVYAPVEARADPLPFSM